MVNWMKYMKKFPDNLSRKIQEVALSKDWNQLPYQLASQEIERLSCADKEKLANLFFLQGQEFMSQSEETKEVEAALASFKEALRVDPTQTAIWTAYAQAYFKLAQLNQNEEYLSKAHELFTHAEMLFHTQGHKLPLDTLWEWGKVLYQMAKHSEEALDFKRSLEKFHEAHARGLHDPDFLLQFGTALGEFGVITGQEELILQATPILEACLKLNADNAFAWLRLACVYKILYFCTGDVGFYEKADQSFLAVARIDSEHVPLWLNWGQLLILEGKTARDDALLVSALEKLEKADRILPNDPVILMTLADALIQLGSLAERVDYLKEAKNKLELVLKMVPENIEALCLLGHCYIHLGRYFADPVYIEEAIDRFKTGVSLNKKVYILWHGLSMAHMALGDLRREPGDFEKSAKFCSQAIRLGGEAPGYWNDWGVALMKLGDLTTNGEVIASALEKFEEAIRCYHRKHQGSPDPDWVYNYGCALDFLGDYEHNPLLYERAIAVLGQLHEHYPDAPHIRYNLAIAFYHFGDAASDEMALEKSIEHLEALAAQDPEDDNIFNELGLVYLTLADTYKDTFQSARSKLAFEHAEQGFLHSIACGGVESNYWLSCLYCLQENYSDAIYFLERTRQAGALPSPEEILSNDWLAGLKNSPHFRAFLTQLE
jgi:tetratricopeptide (TPR) repeat protein